MKSSFRLRCVAAGVACWAGVGAQEGMAQGASGTPTGAFIRAWQVAGPFEAQSVLDEIPLEGVSWKVVKMATDVLDFESPDVFGQRDHVVAFAKAEIESEREGDVILGFGSDDSAIVWWNGRQVLVQNVLRPTKPGEDRVHLRMQKGRNVLLAKVFDAGGGWSLAADLRVARGAPWSWEVVLPLSDDDFLDLVQRKAFDYFWNEAHPETGLIPDYIHLKGAGGEPASVATLGFGLTAICVADARGWVTREEAVARVVRVLRFVRDRMTHEHGFLYHWVDRETGARFGDSEISSIDTALFLAGALTCREYFLDSAVTELVDELYRRVDWVWMLNGGETLSMGWRPESGFITFRWDTYSEHMVMYLLAIGSPTHPLPAETWYAWRRPIYSYEGMTYVQAVPLFLHQYSHIWVDFRNRRDAIADYFRNSELATRAHRAFCLSLRDRFPGYHENLWGLTASMAPGGSGYAVWGGPPPTLEFPVDGTVVPAAAGGSLPFVPDLTLPVLREIFEKHRGQVWGRYGFLDAFNPNTGWVANGYIGIDLGPILLMAENHRTGRIWQWFGEAEEIRRAMRDVGFKDTGRDLDKADLDYLRELARATWACIAHFVHPETQMPYDSSRRDKYTSVSNIGLYLAALAVARDMGFLSPAEALERATRLVESVEKFPTWKGFAQCWHAVDDLTPSPHDTWVSAVDSGNFALGLVVAGQAFPELAERCAKLLDDMDWSALYDEHGSQLYGGYDMKEERINPDWRVDQLATDSRVAAFMAVASGRVPPGAWTNLQRKTEERYHVKYLKPGWVGGGLFMQYLPGIFLNERGTLVGRSAANLAYDNMRHADEKKWPAWGWSSCVNPDGGYLGWGMLRDEVVTPHACVLAIEDFPKEVVRNLYVLQRYGVRAPWREDGREHDFGFRDSVNLGTGKVAEEYLVLDQGMLFLSLANFLEGGIVRKYVLRDPKVRAAVERIPDLAAPEGEHTSLCEPGLGKLIPEAPVARTLDVVRLTAAPRADGDGSDWTGGERVVIGFPANAEFGVPPNKDRFEATFRFGWDDEALYLLAEVREDELVCAWPASELYKGDAIELFLDPRGDGFVWGNPSDFQIGFSPSGPEGRAQVYAWFQKAVPEGVEGVSRVNETPDGVDYVIEAKIPWRFLAVEKPAPGREIQGSLAVHTVDRAGKAAAKINWSYVTDAEGIRLGTLRLTD